MTGWHFSQTLQNCAVFFSKSSNAIKHKNRSIFLKIQCIALIQQTTMNNWFLVFFVVVAILWILIQYFVILSFGTLTFCKFLKINNCIFWESYNCKHFQSKKSHKQHKSKCYIGKVSHVVFFAKSRVACFFKKFKNIYLCLIGVET